MPLIFAKSERILPLMGVTAKALVALLCVLQTLPPGWCCLLPVRVASCCKQPATPPVETAPKSCCCSAEKPEMPPATVPVPTAPHICCCEHYPGMLPEAPVTLAAPTITAVASFVVAAPAAIGAAGAVVGTAPPVSPHRHVLLCVWTC